MLAGILRVRVETHRDGLGMLSAGGLILYENGNIVERRWRTVNIPVR